MTQDDDEFEGIDISGPWGGIRIGSGGVRVGRDFIHDDDRDVRQARRRVREQLGFYRNVAYFVVVVGVLTLLDWSTGGGWWVQWVAAIWGGILALQFLSQFVAPNLWGREVEERMVARELERRRPELITAAWWKEERGKRVFIDFNQNAPHKTVFGAWSVRARVGAQVSTPFLWDEVDDVHPDELTMATVPARVAADGDPWAEVDAQPQSLQPLLDMYERDLASGLQDAPWPPVYPKMPGEPARVAPSRAKKPRA